MSPLPWPLIGRRDPYRGVAAPPVRLYEQPAVRVVTDASVRAEPVPPGPTVPQRPAPTAWESTRHMWEAGEATVLDDLTTLTARYGPWTAAVLLFTNPKENPDV